MIVLKRRDSESGLLNFSDIGQTWCCTFSHVKCPSALYGRGKEIRGERSIQLKHLDQISLTTFILHLVLTQFKELNFIETFQLTLNAR